MARRRVGALVAVSLAALAGGWGLAHWATPGAGPSPAVDGPSARGPEPPPESSRPTFAPIDPATGIGSAALRAPAAERPKLFPPPGSPAVAWADAIAGHRERGHSVALQAILEARPGGTPDERARLLALAASALASVGLDPRADPEMRANARRAFDDLLASPHREVRLAALNAFALAYPAEREAVLTSLESDPDPVIRAKAQALLAALR